MIWSKQVKRKLSAVMAVSASLLICLTSTTPAIAGQIELADILEIDALGYRCIPSAYFDDQDDGSAAIAFSLSGKTRLPRTCLPDPCARALTPQELSSITGTEPILARFHDEWDDYYARYADHCRREVVVSRPRAKDTPNAGFWPPIIRRARIIQQTGVPTSSRLRPFIPGGLGVPTSGTGAPVTVSFLIPPNAANAVPRADRPIPSPIPIPASGLMLGLAIGVGAILRRRRRTASFVANPKN